MPPGSLRGALGLAVGRQMAAKTALEALLGGSWGGLGGSWARLFGPSWPCLEAPGRPREALGKGSGRPCWCFFGWSSARS